MAVASDDDTLSDDRKRELVTGKAVPLIGDNLQHLSSAKSFGSKSGAICCGKMKDIVIQEK